MNMLVTLAAALAFLMPIGVGQFAGPESTPSVPAAPEVVNAAPKTVPSPPLLGFSAPSAIRVLQETHHPPIQNQVRIEERVIIRISPSPAARAQMFASSPQPPRLAERELDSCVPIGAIGGFQPGEDNRLLLFLRDRQVLSAVLERACSSRDFYSGFYVARSADGMLCAKRDKLQSRAGASCELAKISRLVAVRE